ncbi:MAG: hypothetical protein ISQ34_01075 [Rickettsiales bacterium]|nr:hypothetical protein [Rickettsiales bacterium]
MNNVNFLKRAFSMIEMAVFITVISFVLVAFALSLGGDIENDKVVLTRKRIDRIYNALGLYVAQNSRLPCPGAINTLLSSSSYGNEGITGGICDTTSGAYFTTTDLVYGMVPIKELGLSLDDSVDGFGSKFVYIVDRSFAETGYDFATDDGTITIKKHIDGSSSNVATAAVFVIMSYGKNKKGAFNMNSISQIAASSDADEIDNGSANLDDKFVAFSDRGTFDDIVFYRDNKSDFLLDFDILHLYRTNRTESN